MLPNQTKMTLKVRYENGVFRPLDAIEGIYQDGEVLEMVVSPQTTLKKLLADMMPPYPFLGESYVENDDDTTQQDLDALIQGVTLSDAIIEERHAE